MDSSDNQNPEINASEINAASSSTQPGAVETSPSFLDILALFSSAGTLICCALPALLVTIGAGSVLASIVSNVPALIWISKQKLLVFGFAGSMLFLGGLLRWKVRDNTCPVDSKLAAACSSTRRFSAWIYFLSCFLYLLGVLFTFILPRLI